MRSLFLFFVCAIAGPSVLAQHLSFQDWQRNSIRDIRLRPRYGDVPKSEAQKGSDAEFIKLTLAQDSVPRSASNLLVAHGFDLLRQGDHTKAMYRFNQAFLLDSTNADVYWGYGSFFMELDRTVLAHTMFRAGLSLDDTNGHLLTGEATAYLADQHLLVATDSVAAQRAVDDALVTLNRAQIYHPKDPGVLYRLAVCHLLRGECAEARGYFDRCKELPHAPIERGFEERLNKACPR